MRRLLLFDDNYVKKESLVELNVDSKVLSKTIFNTQEIELKDILGDTLYNSVIEAVYQTQNNIPLTDSYKTLLNGYIFPYLLHQTVANYIIANHYKLTNKGLVRLTDNNAINVNNDEIEQFKDYYDNYSNSYKKNLVDYLRVNNLTAVTDYVDTNVTKNAIGWYLGGGRYKGGYTNVSVTNPLNFSGTFSIGNMVATVINGSITTIQ